MLRFSANIARCDAGYAWERRDGSPAEDGSNPPAEDLILRPQGREYTNYYDPFVAEPALFRIFAGLSPTPDSILAFASKYGDIALLDDSFQSGGMSLEDWQHEIDRFRQLMRTADWFVARSVTRRNWAKHAQLIASFIEPLLNMVPVFLSAAISSSAIDLRGNLVFLRDVLFMQVVESVVERKQYRTCEYCGKPFELTPQINRSDRIFCSDNCRVKAYQRRRKQAIAMRAKGETLREIAKELGSDVPTVKKWVGEAG